MVSKAFKTCLLLIEKMVKNNFVNQIGKTEVENLIAHDVGADRRTLDKYVGVCVRFKLLEAHPVSKNVFYINLVEADRSMRVVFGRPVKQLTLPS